MTLNQLGEEYLRQARELETVIEGTQKRAETARGVRLYELQGQLLMLREMEQEMRLTGLILKEYYVIVGQGRIYHRPTGRI